MVYRHPNILKLYGYFDDNEHICMVLENAPGGSLYDIAQKESPIPEDKVAKVKKKWEDDQRMGLGVA